MTPISTQFDRSSKLGTTWVSLAVVVASRTIILGFLSNPGDVKIYYDYSQRASAGQTVYKDFDFEYPPLAWAFISIPRVLHLDSDFESYHKAYRVQCYLIDLAVLFLLLYTFGARGPFWVYTIGTLVLGNLLYDRLDIVLAFVFVSAGVAHRKGHLRCCYTMLGTGVAFKFFPILLLPGFISWEFFRSRRRGSLAALFSFLGVAVPSCAAIAVWGPATAAHLNYHAARGTQIESLWATVQILLSELSILSVEVQWAYGCHNVASVIEDELAMLALIALLLLSFVAVLLHRFRRHEQSSPWDGAAATLAGCLALSKVLSPQFFVFFLAILATVLSVGHRRGSRYVVPLLICALTTAVYPYQYGELLRLEPVPVVLVAIRNVLLLAFTVLLYCDWLSGAPFSYDRWRFNHGKH